MSETNTVTPPFPIEFESLVDYIDELLSVKSDNLDSEALRGTKIFAQLQKMYAFHARKLASLKQNQERVEMHRWKRYAGKWTAQQYKDEPLTEAVLKQDIDKYMSIDPVVVEMDNMVREQDRIVSLIEESIKQNKDRGWNIKNAIEFRRLIAGG